MTNTDKDTHKTWIKESCYQCNRCSDVANVWRSAVDGKTTNQPIKHCRYIYFQNKYLIHTQWKWSRSIPVEIVPRKWHEKMHHCMASKRLLTPTELRWERIAWQTLFSNTIPSHRLLPMFQPQCWCMVQHKNRRIHLWIAPELIHWQREKKSSEIMCVATTQKQSHPRCVASVNEHKTWNGQKHCSWIEMNLCKHNSKL